jgi:hypothetical protein
VSTPNSPNVSIVFIKIVDEVPFSLRIRIQDECGW